MAGSTYATPAALIGISILFPILGTIAVSLRFYARRTMRREPWLPWLQVDDWLTIPALVCSRV